MARRFDARLRLSIQICRHLPEVPDVQFVTEVFRILRDISPSNGIFVFGAALGSVSGLPIIISTESLFLSTRLVILLAWSLRMTSASLPIWKKFEQASP